MTLTSSTATAASIASITTAARLSDFPTSQTSIPARSVVAMRRLSTRRSRLDLNGEYVTLAQHTKAAWAFHGRPVSSRPPSPTAPTVASKLSVGAKVAGTGTLPSMSSATHPSAAHVAGTSRTPSVLARWTSSTDGRLTTACHSLRRHLYASSARLRRSRSRTLPDGSRRRPSLAAPPISGAKRDRDGASSAPPAKRRKKVAMIHVPDAECRCGESIRRGGKPSYSTPKTCAHRV